MSIVGILRQGDVILIPVGAGMLTKEHVPVAKDPRGVVLAEGEVTGHHHRIRDPGVCFLRKEGVSDRVLTVEVSALLEHEEHGSIPIGPGTYIVRIQREWSGEDERQVQD